MLKPSKMCDKVQHELLNVANLREMVWDVHLSHQMLA